MLDSGCSMSYIKGYHAYARGVESGAVPWHCDSPMDWHEGWDEAESDDLASTGASANGIGKHGDYAETKTKSDRH